MNSWPRNEQNNPSARCEATRAEVFTPRIDIVETDAELVLYADLPGVAPENLDVRYEDGRLTLEGRVSPRQSDVRYGVREYGVGNFQRSFAIGESIDASRIAAELSRGVLVLHLPKVERAQPRRIPVQTL
ncbi:MAG: Hsp20/alpha crystallin family protein [Pirellulales bacterium]